MPHSDDSSKISRVKAYLGTVEGEINNLGIVPHSPDQALFDSIGLATLSKAFALARACLALLDAGFPDEACGLSRSLVECAVNLRYLTQDPTFRETRATEFTQYAVAEKCYWVDNALQQFQGRAEEHEIRDYARGMGVEPDPKAASRHWSGENGFVWKAIADDHPLDGATNTKRLRKAAFAVDYHQTSGFVHCSEPALANYVPQPGLPFRISPSSEEFFGTGQKVLFTVVIYLHSAVAYVLCGLGIPRPTNLNDGFAETLQFIASNNVAAESKDATEI